METIIIVEGWVRLEPGEATRMQPAAIAMAAATRKEPGCLDYAFSQDLSDPDLVRIAERWRDEDALQRHFTQPHMATFNAALASAKILGSSVNMYRAELVRPLTAS